MIAPAYAVVEPLAVVVKSVNAGVTDDTVTAPREGDDFALWTNLSDIEFVEKLHQGDVIVPLYDPRSQRLDPRPRFHSQPTSVGTRNRIQLSVSSLGSRLRHVVPLH